MSGKKRENNLGTRGTTTVDEGEWKEKPVAIKRMELFNTYDKKEVEALKKLNHPNIVKLLHDQSDENCRIYYLELCNASLDKLFLKDGDPEKYLSPMPPPEEVLCQLAEGLDYIHTMGFIHWNIKPENVLIWVNPENGQVWMKWADFGLSKPVNERGTCSRSDFKGTNQWLAPELLELLDNEDLDEDEEQRGTIKTDVFAEGLVFGYYLMGGVHLYGSGFDIPMNILNNKQKNLDETKLGFASEIIMEMLEVNPEKRITSSQVAQRLVALVEHMQFQIAEEEQTISQVLQIKVNEQVILGFGGFGMVFEGEWKNNKVAVKRIAKRATTTRDGQEEEEALKTLDHPNVNKLLHVESDKKYKYYALELCKASLDKLFLKDGYSKKYRGPMPPTIDVLCQLADGLAYIHRMKFIHRDISPNNVLIWVNPKNTEEVLMKWTVFGFGKVNERGTYNKNGVPGPENWLAPEILTLVNSTSSSNNDIISARLRGSAKSDVYAEGLVFGHFLLNGRHIFGKLIEIPLNILDDEKDNINDIKPESYRELIEDMIKFEPEKRISSEQVADRLKIIKNQTPQVHTSSTRRRSPFCPL